MAKVESKAFVGLPNLHELNLYKNRLGFNESFADDVFISLKYSLKILDIRNNILGNIDKVNYPLAVAQLDNLEELKLDCLTNKTLPKEYGNMKHLRKLLFVDGRPEVGSLSVHMFDAVSRSNISEISLAGLYIDTIKKDTFSKLHKLRILDLSNNPYLNLRLDEFAPFLNSTSLEILRLNNTGIGFRNSAKTLRSLCDLGLKQLTLDQNSISDLDDDFSECQQQLEILSLGDNFLLPSADLWMELFYMENLIGFNISYQGKMIHHNTDDVPNIATNGKPHPCLEDMACPVFLPPKLKWIEGTHYGGTVPTVTIIFENNSTLKYFNASHSAIKKLDKIIYCAFDTIPKIETIDLSNNGLRCINASMFDKRITNCDWKSLKNLYLGNNYLGRGCHKKKKEVLGFLKPLTNLHTLDLSANRLKSTNRIAHLDLSQIRTLKLSSNYLKNFFLNIHGMTMLKKLDLSSNNLSYLLKNTILQLEYLQSQKREAIEVDLSGNTLSCKCGQLDFLGWMLKTSVSLVNRKNYTCVLDGKMTIKLNNLKHTLDNLQKQCFGRTWVHVFVISEIAIYFSITSLCLLYRIRHTIKYFLLRLRLNRHKLRTFPNHRKYSYSAFVCCEWRDARHFVYRKLLPNLETEETKLKFCVAQRNFLVGATIIDNILRALDRSKKVIFIVSRYFIESNWCKEELLMAHRVCLFFFTKVETLLSVIIFSFGV